MPVITPSGEELLVNTSTFGNQLSQVVTPLADGRYLVVWIDYVINGPLSDAAFANADVI